MGKTYNILVTGCGGDIGQSIGKILLKSTFTKNLYGIDISDKNAAQFIYPNFSVGLPCKHPEYLKNLEVFIEKNAIDILIPMSEPELRYFSEQNLLYKIGNAKMITASASALEVGFDKYRTVQFLEAEGFPFLKTVLAKDVKEITSFPLILKSRKGSGSKDIYKINSFDEFLFYTKNNKENYIIQEFVNDYQGEFTCGLFRSSKGIIRSLIFKRELLEGHSVYGEVVENNTITHLLETIAVKLDLRGSINVQLRIKDNVPKIFEINPRFSSTVLFRHLLDFKDLEWSIQDILKQEISTYKTPKIGTRFYKGHEEYISQL
ncbi:ATP-grasp domain-containing protein [Polaribacter litorisediminis]|uniref:ATP-grasp domain-containing protein n=1 Tax=Polaribacter litorisediminis TaxID=1908341 RepID=UPI001CBEC174|nr:ATP-grasp domain-containing protein [Polaribacter litorisediminis]UAM97203.1 ATP-grasp domain-containing protein [Polaribacter litorisediminis]